MDQSNNEAANRRNFDAIAQYVNDCLTNDANPLLRCAEWDEVEIDVSKMVIPLFNVDVLTSDMMHAIQSQFRGAKMTGTTRDMGGRDVNIIYPLVADVPRPPRQPVHVAQAYVANKPTILQRYMHLAVYTLLIVVTLATLWRQTTQEDWLKGVAATLTFSACTSLIE